MNHPIMIANDGGSDAFGSMLIEVNGNRLDCKYLKSTGVVYDEFTIIKPDGSTPAPVSIQNNSELFVDPRVYPNPAGDFLQVEFSLREEKQTIFSLFDFNGREIFSETVQSYPGNNRKLFNIKDLAPGNYIVNIKSDREMLSLPFSHN
jgi:hypothetical protein